MSVSAPFEIAEDDDLYGKGLIINTDFTWNVRNGIFRPTISGYQCLGDSLQQSNGKETYFKFTLTEGNDQPSEPLINIGHIGSAGPEGWKIKKLPTTATDNGSVLEVKFPAKVEYFDVMRKFFYCQSIHATTLPDGLEFFAQNWGFVQLFNAYFLGRIGRDFGHTPESHLRLQRLVTNFISYAPLITCRLPQVYMDHFARSLAIGFDQLDLSDELWTNGIENLFKFLKSQGQLCNAVRAANDIGSQELTCLLLQLVIKFQETLGDDEMPVVLKEFDWRDLKLTACLDTQRKIPNRFWKHLARTKADFRQPALPLRVIRTYLHNQFGNLLLHATERQPDFCVQESRQNLLVQGYRLDRRREYSLYLITRGTQYDRVVIFVPHKDSGGQSRFQCWEFYEWGKFWPEVTFTETSCSCFDCFLPGVRRGSYMERRTIEATEICKLEDTGGNVVMLLGGTGLKIWPKVHKDCSLFVKILLVSDKELANPHSLTHIPHFYRNLLRDAPC